VNGRAGSSRRPVLRRNVTRRKAGFRAVVARLIVRLGTSPSRQDWVPGAFLIAFVSALIPIVGDHRGRDDFHESATRSGSRQTRG
jgi:hypothetical protein